MTLENLVSALTAYEDRGAEIFFRLPNGEEVAVCCARVVVESERWTDARGAFSQRPRRVVLL